MSKIESGRVCILNEPTFIFKGVIIQANSQVQIKEYCQDGTYTVIYTDKEGMPNEIPNILESKLTLVD